MRLTDSDIQLQNRSFKRVVQAEAIDQQNASFTGGSSANDLWQSITPSVTGLLTAVGFDGTGGTYTGVRLRIYEGEGTGGTLLATVTGLTLNTGANKFVLPLPVSQIAGLQITAQLDIPTSLGTLFANSNVYPGGRSSLNPNYDFVFQTYVTPIKIEKDSQAYEFPASETNYDNSVSGLAADNVQDAIDELPIKDEIGFDVGQGSHLPGTVDQQSLTTNGVGGGLSDSWQSYTAGVDTPLLAVAVLCNQDAIGTFEIRDGEGSGGALLDTQANIVVKANEWVKIPIPSKPAQVSTQQYTWRFIASSVQFELDTTNPYSGGRSSVNAAYDFAFKTYSDNSTLITKKAGNKHFSDQVDYDNTASGIVGDTVKEALDDLAVGSFKNSGAVKIDSNGDTSEPTYVLAPNVRQHIHYVSPLLDAATFFPETAPAKDVSSVFLDYYPYGSGTGTITSSGLTVTGIGTAFLSELNIGSYIEVGGQKRGVASVTNDTSLTLEQAFTPDITVPSAFLKGFEAVFLENPVLGQLQYWRVSFSYSGKGINTAEGVKIFLTNPLSGFERVLNTTLPEGETAEDFITVDVATYADANSLAPPLGTGTGGYQLSIESTKQPITVVIKDVTRLNNRY